jgi:ribosomal protein L11 methyltransferase
MSWIQLRLDTHAGLAAACEDALLELGAVAVTLQDSADEPLYSLGEATEQLWQETRITGLFPAAAGAEQLWLSLPDTIRSACHYHAEILEERDWEREWMRHYQPSRVSEGFWLVPSWLTPPEPTATNLLLDPGLAFGTGTHPTTLMCLERLAQLDLRGQHLVDYGCGSGILAVAGLLLGADSAVATDIDPQALNATRENARRNGIAAERIVVSKPGQLVEEASANLVIANILAGPLCELAQRLCGMLRPGGRLLLSGLLETQVERLREHYPLALALCSRRDDWVLLEASAE